MSTNTTVVSELSDCDACKQQGKKEPAEYDAHIPLTGSWGNLCQQHFNMFQCTLGLGQGQKLVLESPEPQERKDKADELCEQCGKNCPDDYFNKNTARYRVLGDSIKTMLMLSTGLYCEEV